MKYILMIILISILIMSFQKNGIIRESSSIKIKVKDIEKLDINNVGNIAGLFYYIKIEMINNSDSVICYWTMNCSWDDNWIFDNKQLSLYPQECTRNFPVKEQINPNHKKVIKSIVYVKDSLKLTKDKYFKGNNIYVKIRPDYINGKFFRIGFVLVKKEEVSTTSDFREILYDKIKEQKDLIWSDPFKIGE